MAKLTAAQALKTIEVSKATLYRDINSGKVSCEIDNKGRKVIDTSELIRVYGELKTPKTQETVSRNGSMKPQETGETVSLLKQKIGFLESQLEDSKKREDDLQQQRERLYQERDKLLGIVENQQIQLLEDKREKPENPTNKQAWFNHPLFIYPLTGALTALLIVLVLWGSVGWLF